ncbi:MAG: hypothetical protein R3F29_11650 [Planctomycetota bacterium]
MPHHPHPLWQLPFAICLTTLLAAAQQQSAPQLELAAGKALQQALRATAQAGATEFTAECKWPDLRSRGTQPELENPPVERQRGTFDADLVFVGSDEEGDRWQAWQVGRTCVVSQDGKTWQLASQRGKRHPNGGRIDPLPLLLGLAEHALPVAQHAIAERDGRAVERFSVLLDQATTEVLTDVGAIRDPNPSMVVARSLLKSGTIQAGDLPVGYTDLCIELDVATRTVSRIHLRALVPGIDPRELLQRARGRKAARDDAADGGATAAIEFADGLPVRETKDLAEAWLVVRFGDVGKAAKPSPDAAVLQALGR